MAYIEFHQALATHKKVLKLAGILKMRRAHVLGHLALLWAWALDNAPAGDLTDVDDEAIKLAADWPKKAETFIGALNAAGFLDGRQLHDWSDYGGKLIERRAYEAERQRVRRAGRTANVRSTSHGRVEKSREEKSRSTAPPTDVRRNGHHRSARQWYELTMGKAVPRALRETVDGLHDEHPVECIEWAFMLAADKEQPWPYARKLLQHPPGEHGPPQPVEFEDEFDQVAQRAV